jgi:hypothetical protein
MIAAYIIAGAILGFFSTGFIAMFKGLNDSSPSAVRLLIAFAGGAGGHCLYTLLTN